MTGRYGGPDEPAHVLRAHAVANGDLLGAPADGLPPGYRTVTVPAGLGTGDPACYRHDPDVPSGCADGERDGEVTVSSSAGTNPPLYYALVGLPPRLLGVADDPLAYRLSAAALVAIVLGLVVARLGVHGDHAVLVAALITPSCWFLWGVVNPNAIEIALVALAATGATGAMARLARLASCTTAARQSTGGSRCRSRSRCRCGRSRCCGRSHCSWSSSSVPAARCLDVGDSCCGRHRQERSWA